MAARIPIPSACRWDGLPERGHCQQWKPPVGWHKWEPPTDAQILARMQARRAARTTTTTTGETR